MADNDSDSTVKIQDKRRFNDKGEVREGVPEKAEGKKVEELKQEAGGKKPEDVPVQEERKLPKMNFPTFVLSLASSAQMHLGLIPDPVKNETKVTLPFAKQTIDILEMLQEKTNGNLEDHEAKLLEQVLFELRMQYVEKKGS